MKRVAPSAGRLLAAAARVLPAAKAVLKHAGKAAAGVLPAALLARLGLPALAVLVVAVGCWVINSKDRSDRASQLLLAGRGDASALTPGSSPVSPPGSGQPAQRRRVTRPARDAPGDTAG